MALGHGEVWRPDYQAATRAAAQGPHQRLYAPSNPTPQQVANKFAQFITERTCRSHMSTPHG